MRNVVSRLPTRQWNVGSFTSGSSSSSSFRMISSGVSKNIVPKEVGINPRRLLDTLSRRTLFPLNRCFSTATPSPTGQTINPSREQQTLESERKARDDWDDSGSKTEASSGSDSRTVHATPLPTAGGMKSMRLDHKPLDYKKFGMKTEPTWIKNLPRSPSGEPMLPESMKINPRTGQPMKTAAERRRETHDQGAMVYRETNLEPYLAAIAVIAAIGSCYGFYIAITCNPNIDEEVQAFRNGEKVTIICLMVFVCLAWFALRHH